MKDVPSSQPVGTIWRCLKCKETFDTKQKAMAHWRGNRKHTVSPLLEIR